jgi:hypothetical protein
MTDVEYEDWRCTCGPQGHVWTCPDYGVRER